MKPSSCIASILLSLFLFYAPAHALNLKLESSCGLESTDLEVEVFNPPGGYLSVNPDLSVTASVPAGTKLSVLKKPTSTNYDIDLLGPWTPAAEGGTLQVMCRGGMCPTCASREAALQQRYNYCVENKLYTGHDQLEYCSVWMGTCTGPISVGGATFTNHCAPGHQGFNPRGF